MAIQLRILGPLEMLRDGSSVQPTSAKQRLLLAVLVVHANEVVSVDALVEALWQGRPPVTAPSVLQTYVSQLRKLIEPGLSRRDRPQVLLTVEPGYSLTVGLDDLDATRFERLLASGRAAARDNKPTVAAELLREGLGLWRGSALADVADEEPVRAEAQRLDALRVYAVEERLEVDIALGRHDELIGELTQLVAADPLRERLWAQLMLCLYRVGRQAEALAAYQQLRHYLADELGLDPSTELTRLENNILAHAPSLEWSSPESRSDRVAVGRELPYGSNRPIGSDRLLFVGREAEIDELRGWGPDDPSGAPMALVTRDAGVGKTRVVDLGEATRDAEDLLRLDPPDVANPEHVWQLSGRGLDDRFPPLRSADTFRGRLPTRLSSFVGREAEQRDLAHVLAGSRLLTLVGPGGMGKTRLALAVATNAVERFGEGVWFIELAPLSDPEAVPIAVATTLGFQTRPGISTTELLVQGLGGWAALIVVDNCEHLLAVAGELIAVLLDRCPNLVVLATSRAPLRIAGEQVRHVGPLDLETDAPALFAARATAVRPDFRLDPTAGVAVREVCRALDGMPLAIELAAARLRSMTVSEVRDRLDQRFRLLRLDRGAQESRHATLSAVVEWSYGLLGPRERSLLCELGVFAGGFDLAGAHAIRRADSELDDGGEDAVVPDELDTLDLLDTLVGQSLVEASTLDGRTRFSMLETLRQFASDQWNSAQRARLHVAHAAHFLEFACRADSELGGADQAKWLTRLEAEHDNLRAALAWAVGATGDRTVALRLTGALGLFWRIHSHFDEGHRWYAQTLSLDVADLGEQGSVLRCWSLVGAGLLDYAHADYELAQVRLVEAAELADAADDQRAAGWARQGQGRVQLEYRDFEWATSVLEESISCFERVGDVRGRGYSLYFLGFIASFRGERQRAEALMDEARAILETMGDTFGLIGVRYLRARNDAAVGQLSSAADGYAAVLVAAAQLSTRWMTSVALFGLADLAVKLQRWPIAARLYRGAHDVCASFAGDPTRIGGESAQRRLETVRQALGTAAFEDRWAAGAVFGLEAAVTAGVDSAHALASGGDNPEAPTKDLG